MMLFTVENVTAFLVGVFCVVVVFFKWRYRYWQVKRVPFLEPNIPFGNTENPLTRDRSMIFIVKGLYDELKKKGYKHGGVFIIAQPIYIPVDPEFIRNIMSKDFQYFTDRGMYFNEKDDPLSANLFSIEGPQWKVLRAKLTPTFSSGKIKMMFNTLLECGDTLKETVEKYCQEGMSLDIKEVLGCFATDVIGSCAFGLECNSLKDPTNPFRKYSKDVFTLTRLRILRNVLIFAMPNIAKTLRIKLLNPEEERFFLNMVRETVSYREKNDHTRKDFMQLLIDLRKEDPTFRIEQIAAQAFLFFVAGFETTSTTMSFALYELALNQSIQEKARNEIQDVLNSHDGNFTYECLQEMKYLGQIVDETLRKYPAAAFLGRRCTKDYKVEGTDVVLEKGCKLFIPVMGLHHDKEYFPEPQKFDPDRFNDENKRNIKPFTYLPFGEGPRNCIGARFGLMQTRVGLALLLKNYKFVIDEAKTPSPLKYKVNTVFLAVEGGIWLSVFKAY